MMGFCQQKAARLGRGVAVISAGAPGGNRTPDALLRTETLYPLSYRGGTALDYSRCYNQSMSSKKADQSAAFPGQQEGEEVQLLFRQHPLVMRKALIGGLFAIVLGVLPLDFPQVYSSDALAGFCTKLAWGVTAVVLLVWVYRWIGWYYSVFIATNQRIIAVKQKGLFDRKVEEWRLSDITNLNYHVAGFQAVIFGFGTIVARSYIGDLEMKTIHNPAEIHTQLMEVVRKAGGARGSNVPEGITGSTRRAE
jgi:hypothetical protein